MQLVLNELSAHFLKKFPHRFLMTDPRQDFLLVKGYLLTQESDKGLGQLVAFRPKLGIFLV
jgi:hypothetical protein